MDNGNSSFAPQSVAEVADLVKEFYSPIPANRHKVINEQLLKLQWSQEGWQLADELMGNSDDTIRFFAATTFTVKLNNEGSHLDAGTAESVQMRLLAWLARLVQQGVSALVCKKLCSTLTVYFIRTPIHWKKPLLHLALSFYKGDAVSTSEVDESNATMSDLLSLLNAVQLQALVWFADALASEMTKISDKDPVFLHCHREMMNAVFDAQSLLQWCLNQQIGAKDSTVKGEALATFFNWVNYAQPVWPNDPQSLQPLRDLIFPAAQFLLDDDSERDALPIFRDILETYTTFFQPQHMQMLSSFTYQKLRPKLLQALQDEDIDGEPCVQFLTAFGCANIQEIVENPSNELGSGEIINLFLQILGSSGYPGGEDMLSIQIIEFWNTYVEYITDWIGSQDEDEQSPEWMETANRAMHSLVELIWKKLQPPPNDIAKEWGDDQHGGFKEFRLDSTDLVLSIFVLRARDVLDTLISLLLQSLQAQHWQAVEAALFCLNVLASNVLEEPSYEETMGSVFRSSLFTDIADFSRPAIPAQARRTAIDMLGSYGEYIQRHTEFLPDTLRFLFASLEKAGLANGAAKSISSLCDACRAHLTEELPGFLTQYQRFLESRTAEPYTKEKVIGAIASIIQALKPESAKVQPLMALLTNVKKDAEEAQRYANEGDEEMAELMGVSSLECLASIGKAMQVPEDIPIDIYDDDDQPSSAPSYWESGEGQRVQQEIESCFRVLNVVGNYSEAIDAACSALKSGFTETEPGPFVLRPEVTVRFLQSCTVQTPSVETVISTAVTLITQHSRKDSKRIDEEVRSIYTCVASFMRTLGQPGKDPSTSTGCIDVLGRLMPYYTHVLMRELNDPFLLDFTLQAVEGTDHFPKRSACEFWSKLMKPQSAAISPEVQEGINQIIAAYGPKLCLALVHQIGGQAYRSDIDCIMEPLKALLMNQSGTHMWLREALAHDSFPSNRVTMDDRARFLKQITGLRNDVRKLKELVKTFWAACQGTVVSY